ncbi:TraB/GumN family protein [Spirosoma aerophilum]
MKTTAPYFVIILLLLVFRSVSAQDMTTYLRQNSLPFDSAQASSFQLFDSAFYQNDVFLLGEIHGVAATQGIDLTLLKHLNKRVGLRYYLAEMDCGQAALLNAYLDTGNRGLLDSLFRCFLKQTHAGSSQWGNQQFYDKLVHIQAYNQTLPPNARIQFLGVDWFQSNGQLAVPMLKQLVAHCPTTPHTLLDSLRLLVVQDSSLSLKKLFPFAGRINADYAAHQDQYKAVFGNQLLAFRQFFRTLAYANNKMSRDDIAAQMTRFIIDELGLVHEKLYGLWGTTHILQAGVNNQQTFSGLLKAAGRRVVTINTLYKDSEVLLHRDAVPFIFRKKGQEFVRSKYLNSDGPVFKIDGFSSLEPVCAPNTTTLIRLDAPNSPYLKTISLVKMSGITGSKVTPNDPEHNVTTSFFQYVFVVRNSPAVDLWPASL